MPRYFLKVSLFSDRRVNTRTRDGLCTQTFSGTVHIILEYNGLCPNIWNISLHFPPLINLCQMFLVLREIENTVFEFPVTHHYMNNKKANAAAIFKVHHDDFLAQIQPDAYRVYFKFL